MIRNNALSPKAVIGFYNAKTINDNDIELSSNGAHVTTLNMLRSQRTMQKADSPNPSLSDYISPDGNDYMGAFVVTAGHVDEYIKKFEKDNDDYSIIMAKAIADRFAEALAEFMHYEVRTHYWGHSKNESLSKEEIIKEKYQGIRPAPGYAACPDHTEKGKLFNILSATENIDVILTESFAMYPASSVSGWYIAHPEAKYFNVGKIERDQVSDYAKRKSMSLSETEKWLSPLLNYK